MKALITYISMIFFILFEVASSTVKNIYVSTKSECLTNCGTTEENAYKNLQTALSQTSSLTTYVATDELHFKLIPSQIPFIIDTVTATSPFKTFLGKIFIESNSIDSPAVIFWQTSQFVFEINTFLTIQNVTINGISSHVLQKDCLIAYECCNLEKLAIETAGNPCFLLGKNISTFRNSATMYKGLIILKQSSTLSLSFFNISNFYAIKNYASLIYNINNGANLFVSNSTFDNCNFMKGIIYFYPTIPVQNTILFDNIEISNWNNLNVTIEQDSINIFGSTQFQYFIFGISNYSNPVIFNKLVIKNCRSFYFFMFTYLTLSVENITVKTVEGTLFRMFFNDKDPGVIQSNLIVNKGIFSYLYPNIGVEYIFFYGTGNQIDIKNVNIFNTTGFLFNYFLKIANLEQCHFEEINFPIFFAGFCMIIFSNLPDSITTVNNCSFKNIFNSSNQLFAQAGWINPNEKPNTMIINNTIFIDISFKDGFTFIFSFCNLIIDNTIFSNINCSKSIFIDSPLNHKIEGTINVLLTNSIINKIRSNEIGPIVILISMGKITFVNTTINVCSSGIAAIIATPQSIASFLFINTSFINVNLPISGYYFYLFELHTLEFNNCVFKNITLYSTPVTIAVLIRSRGTKLKINNTIFSSIFSLQGECDLIGATSAIIHLENIIISDVNFHRKGGGINFYNGTSLTIKNLTISNAKHINIQGTDSFLLSIINSNFFNYTTSKLSMFYINNIDSLILRDTNFNNLNSESDAVIFQITSANTIKSKQIIFSNNNFSTIESNPDKANGGLLVFIYCYLPVIFENNIFSNIYIRSGSIILSIGSIETKILNNSFMNLRTMHTLNLLETTNFANISYCFFNNNSNSNGKSGSTINSENTIIYFENSEITNQLNLNDDILTDQYVIFNSINNENKGLIKLTNIKFSNLRFKNGIVNVNSTKLSSKFIFNNISFFNTECTNENIISINGLNGTFQNIIFFENKARKNLLEINILTIIPYSNYIQLNNITLMNNYVFTQRLINIIRINNIEIIDFLLFSNFFYDYLILINEFQNITIQNGEINGFNPDKSDNQKEFLKIIKKKNDNNSDIQIKNLFIKEINFAFLNITMNYKLKLENITILNALFKNTKLLEINSNEIILNYINVINSTIGSLLIKSNEIIVNDILFENINVVNENQLLSINSKENLLSKLELSNFQALNINGGLFISYFSNVLVNNFIYFNNDSIKSAFETTLMIKNSQNSEISNLTIKNIKNVRGISLINEQKENNYILKINNSTFSECGSNKDEGGALKITGAFDIILDAIEFEKNIAKSGSAIFFKSENEKSNILIKNSKFHQNSALLNFTSDLIIPKTEFYDNFIKQHSYLISNPEFKISSYLSYIKAYYKNKNIDEIDVINLYSGEQIDIKFIAYDHFGNRIAHSSILEVQLYTNIPQFKMKNFKSIFNEYAASLLDFHILCNENEKEYFDKKIYLNATFNDEKDKILEKFNISIPIIIKSCDKGKTISADKCVQCQYTHFSLEEKPTNQTQCYLCPSNAECKNGRDIIPKIGYWNLDNSSTQIIKCAFPESCPSFIVLKEQYNLTKKCKGNYQGHVCDECINDYGKSMINECKECSNEELQYHITRCIIRWFVLGMLTLFHFAILNKYRLYDETLLSLYNIFVHHFLVLAFLIKIKTEVNHNIEVFFEIQSVFSFFENNVYLVYCFFVNERGFGLYALILFYILLISLFQYIFAIIGLIILKLGNIYIEEETSSFFTQSLKLLALLLYNNFPTYLFYILGLIFYFKIGDSILISVYFKGLDLGSSEFAIVFCCCAILIILIMVLVSIYLYKKYKNESIIKLMDCEYRLGSTSTFYIHIICFFFLVLLTHYAFVGYNYAIFARNIYMIYLGRTLPFDLYYFKEVEILKRLSLIAIIVSFFDGNLAIIIINSIFFVGICSMIIYKFIKIGK